MALTDDEWAGYIAWQTEYNPDYCFIPPTVGIDLSEDQIHRIIGSYVIATILIYGGMCAVALIVGLAMWLFGVI